MHKHRWSQILIRRLKRASPRNLFKSVVSEADSSYEYARTLARGFGTFGAVFFPLSILVEKVIAPEGESTVFLRLAGSASCIALAFVPEIERRSKAAAIGVWIFSGVFAGVFVFVSMLLLTAAQSSGDTQYVYLWSLQLAVMLPFVGQLMSGWRLLALVTTTGTAMAHLCLLLVDSPNWDAVAKFAWALSPIYCTSLILSALASKLSKFAEGKKTEAALTIATNVAHELRTPLASVRLSASHIHDQLSGHGHRPAGRDGLSGQDSFDSARTAAQAILEETDYANTVIDSILTTNSDPSLPNEAESWEAASQLVGDAIRRYPYGNDAERSAIEVHIERDFRALAKSQIIVHVLFNLLKNGLRYCMRSHEKTVSVHVRYENGIGSIEVCNSANENDPPMDASAFERFHTTERYGIGTGVGLNFCQQAMSALGGRIELLADNPNETKLVLRFPKAVPA